MLENTKTNIKLVLWPSLHNNSPTLTSASWPWPLTFAYMWWLNGHLPEYVPASFGSNPSDSCWENLAEMDVTTYFGLLWPWPLTSWPTSWSFHVLAVWTSCANLLQDRFIRFQHIMVTSFVTNGRTDEKTDGQLKNIMPPPVGLAWQSNNKRSK